MEELEKLKKENQELKQKYEHLLWEYHRFRDDYNNDRDYWSKAIRERNELIDKIKETIENFIN